MAIIMGIDPGSRVTGFGVVRTQGSQVQHLGHGVILLPEKELLPNRLVTLSECLEQLLAKYQPEYVAVEKIFLGKNADSAFKLGHARGVALLEAKPAGAIVSEYATRLVKKGITGKGSAEKETVRQSIIHLLGIQKIDQLDASDALALALYHAQCLLTEKRFARMKEVVL